MGQDEVYHVDKLCYNKKKNVLFSRIMNREILLEITISWGRSAR